MIIVINTKGQFNYQSRKVSREIFNALKEKGHIKETKGFYGLTYSIETETDKGYQQIIRHTKQA